MYLEDRSLRIYLRRLAAIQRRAYTARVYLLASFSEARSPRGTSLFPPAAFGASLGPVLMPFPSFDQFASALAAAIFLGGSPRASAGRLLTACNCALLCGVH